MSIDPQHDLLLIRITFEEGRDCSHSHRMIAADVQCSSIGLQRLQDELTKGKIRAKDRLFIPWFFRILFDDLIRIVRVDNAVILCQVGLQSIAYDIGSKKEFE